MMQSLYYSYTPFVDKAYIIRIKGHELSEKKAQECANSCERIKMPYEFWDAYDGTVNPIKVPDHHSQVMKLIKMTDAYLTRSEVACALSHISLWVKCVEVDKPIVILEHDAIMVEPFLDHGVNGAICYLGCKEQVFEGWKIRPTPPHSASGPNYRFINRAHAYSIDPVIAKNMVAHAIKHGINMPLDMMIRNDLFPAYQMGLYAYDNPSEDTTISGRPKNGRTTERNDNLTY